MRHVSWAAMKEGPRCWAHPAWPSHPDGRFPGLFRSLSSWGVRRWPCFAKWLSWCLGLYRWLYRWRLNIIWFSFALLVSRRLFSPACQTKHIVQSSQSVKKYIYIYTCIKHNHVYSYIDKYSPSRALNTQGRKLWRRSLDALNCPEL